MQTKALYNGGHFGIRFIDSGGGGGGWVLPYISYIGMCASKGMVFFFFFCRFGQKTGINFDHYGVKSGVVFKGITRVYKHICLFNSK